MSHNEKKRKVRLEFGGDHSVNFLGVVGKSNNARGEELNGAGVGRVLPTEFGLIQRNLFMTSPKYL